jgi:CRISPR-associated protein Csy2
MREPTQSIEPPRPPQALLVLPRLRIQHANAISSPLTWGFPAITAFAGLMAALQRRLPADAALTLKSVGVVCHHHQAQTSRGRYSQTFCLTRNPLDKDGGTAAIVEEGRIHLVLSLIFGVEGPAVLARNQAQHAALAQQVAEVLAGMRVAGGSVVPAEGRGHAPYIVPWPEDDDGTVFRQVRRRWLPGYALVSRDGLLHRHHAALRERQPDASLLDAWLDASRLNHRAERVPLLDPATQAPLQDPATGEARLEVRWLSRRPPGWVVPIPVGFGALQPHAQAPDSVRGARDTTCPFRLVESLYSLGEWISPHRLQRPSDLLWHRHTDPETGLYRCINHYQTEALADAEADLC